MTSNTDAGRRVDAFQCADCGTIFDAEDLITVYECSRCSQRSDERRCTEDNMFMGRVDGDCCPECFADAEPVEAVLDHDGTLILADDFDPDGEAATDRKATEAAAQAVARAAKVAEKTAAAKATATKVPWGQVQVGQWVLVDDMLGGLIPAPVLALGVAPDGRIAAILDRYGARCFTFTPDTVADVVPTPTGPVGSVTNLPYGFASVGWLPDDTDEFPPGGGPQIGVEYAPQGEWDVPVVWLHLYGRGVMQTLGCWVDPDAAQAGLDAFDDAARRLAAAQGVTLDPAKVKVQPRRETHVSTNVTGHVDLQIVRVPDGDPMLLVAASAWHRNPAQHMCSVKDPSMLAAGVAAARTVLHTLTWQATE